MANKNIDIFCALLLLTLFTTIPTEKYSHNSAQNAAFGKVPGTQEETELNIVSRKSHVVLDRSARDFRLRQIADAKKLREQKQLAAERHRRRQLELALQRRLADTREAAKQRALEAKQAAATKTREPFACVASREKRSWKWIMESAPRNLYAGHVRPLRYRLLTQSRS